MMKTTRLFTSVCIAALLVSCGGSGETTGTSETTSEETEVKGDDTITRIAEDLDNATFKKYMEEKGGIVIDVRTPEEVEEGAIEGSVNMNFTNGDFEAAIDTLDKTAPTFVYCHGGGRSGQAKDLLIENGFLEVYNLENGYGNWEK